MPSGALQRDEGIVKSVTADELVIQRDNGSEVKLKIAQPNATMPDAGDRVNVQYRLDGMQPVLLNIEKQ